MNLRANNEEQLPNIFLSHTHELSHLMTWLDMNIRKREQMEKLCLRAQYKVTQTVWSVQDRMEKRQEAVGVSAPIPHKYNADPRAQRGWCLYLQMWPLTCVQKIDGWSYRSEWRSSQRKIPFSTERDDTRRNVKANKLSLSCLVVSLKTSKLPCCLFIKKHVNNRVNKQLSPSLCDVMLRNTLFLSVSEIPEGSHRGNVSTAGKHQHSSPTTALLFDIKLERFHWDFLLRKDTVLLLF